MTKARKLIWKPPEIIETGVFQMSHGITCRFNPMEEISVRYCAYVATLVTM